MRENKVIKHRHKWQAEQSGCRDNPGIWSLGGSRWVKREVCACGRTRCVEWDELNPFGRYVTYGRTRM